MVRAKWVDDLLWWYHGEIMLIINVHCLSTVSLLSLFCPSTISLLSFYCFSAISLLSCGVLDDFKDFFSQDLVKGMLAVTAETR